MLCSCRRVSLLLFVSIMLSLGRISASAFLSKSHYASASLRSGRATRILSSSTTSLNSTLSEMIRVEAEIETNKLIDHYQGQSGAPLLWSTKEEALSYIEKNIDAALFDCDGVLYRTPDPIPGAKECIESMISAGKKVLFVTNNAGVNRLQLKEKLSKLLDIDGLTENQMVSASYSAAQYLKQKLANQEMSGNRIHVIGSQGLCDELENFGFDISGGPSMDEKADMDRQDLADYEFPESPIDAIVCGHDTAFTFRKLSIASVLLQKNPDAIVVATNKDSFDLVGADGRHIPGNGAIVAALEYCSRRTAINTGKPSKDLLDILQREHNLDLKRTCFVGDRLDTDIKFGRDNDMLSILVMTGVTTAEKIIELGNGTDEEPLPAAIVSHVGKLVR